MKPDDLDDLDPPVPDTAMLEHVHSRSGAFRQRRRIQRLTSVVTGLVVLTLAGGITLTQIDTTTNNVTTPASSTTTPSTSPPSDVTVAMLLGDWDLLSRTGYDGPLTSPPLSKTPRMRFASDDTWNGSDGCNSLSGSYVLSPNGAIDFGSTIGTLVGCPHQAGLRNELESVRRVSVRDGRLTFFGADDHELAQYERIRVNARLVLPSTTLIAGSEIRGTIVVENNSGHELQATGCVNMFKVGLVNQEIEPMVGWLDCLQQFTIPIGTSSHQVQVTTRYFGCSQTPQPDVPTCESNRPPSVPPGTYQATVFASDDSLPIPPPVTVRVVPESGRGIMPVEPGG